MLSCSFGQTQPFYCIKINVKKERLYSAHFTHSSMSVSPPSAAAGLVLSDPAAGGPEFDSSDILSWSLIVKLLSTILKSKFRLFISCSL